ncbi:hypothetical protein BT96DRAFT_924848 [Gymnopus androsaceus JB14]|uniref:Uncharacterized protein n=1 Tax=Gymnopus androsaceus JB14 TaxID=1447944 RepID=A0A6A4H3B3_9AGAR|nr:hypothetical protein BT96DRAFT_924848 [Gymnopus androsaceus JB14]
MESTPTSTLKYYDQMNLPGSEPQVISFSSRHFAGLEVSLSRYKRRWFITFPRAYGMIAPQRILSPLNIPDDNMPEEHARNHFWYNPSVTGNENQVPYKPDDPEARLSPIHMLLDGKAIMRTIHYPDVPQIARMTGRMRSERSSSQDYSKGKEVVCYEVEVLIPDEGLLRQCYYCLAWEASGPMKRWKPCGEYMFWCGWCQSRGWLVSSTTGAWGKLLRDTWTPLLNKNYYRPRDSLYSSP